MVVAPWQGSDAEVRGGGVGAGGEDSESAGGEAGRERKAADGEL